MSPTTSSTIKPRELMMKKKMLYRNLPDECGGSHTEADMKHRNLGFLGSKGSKLSHKFCLRDQEWSQKKPGALE